MNIAVRNHTRSLRADIQRLAGTMPANDLCRRLQCTPGTLRTIASELGVSTRFGGRAADPERPGADDRAIARIDARRPCIAEHRILLEPNVAARIRREAGARNRSAEEMIALIMTTMANDACDLFAAVLDDR